MRLSRSDFNAIRAKAQEKKAKREEKASTLWPRRVVRKPGPSNSDLEARLWKAFSEYIRARDRKAIGSCFYCGTGPIECAGHLISRQRRATKYHELNVWGSCNSDNWKDKFLPGHHDRMVDVFITKHGVENYQMLVNLSRETVKHSRADVIEMTEHFKRKMEAI